MTPISFFLARLSIVAAIMAVRPVFLLPPSPWFMLLYWLYWDATLLNLLARVLALVAPTAYPLLLYLDCFGAAATTVYACTAGDEVWRVVALVSLTVATLLLTGDETSALEQVKVLSHQVDVTATG